MSDKRGAMKRRRPCARCVWQEDVEGYWAGNCGIHWCLEDGTPKENGMNFCPRCGKRLEQRGGASANRFKSS